jgi:hypothetical protein
MYDTNSDNALNPEDDMTAEKYAEWLLNCDVNFDGTVD